MAFEDWNFGGLKARVLKRVRDLPIVADPLMLGLAVNKGYQALYLHARVNTSIMKTQFFILPTGHFAGSYAMEYPLPLNVLRLATVNVDGYQLQGPVAENEIDATGLEWSFPTSQGDPREFSVRTEPDGTKTLVLFPRPTRAQWINIFGVIAPPPLVNDTDVPVIGETFGDPIELYAAHFLLEGIDGEEASAERYRQLYLHGRDESKRNLRLDRTYRIQRQRQW